MGAERDSGEGMRCRIVKVFDSLARKGKEIKSYDGEMCFFGPGRTIGLLFEVPSAIDV